MTNGTAGEWNRSGTIAMLWAGVFSGPVGWALDVGISYALVQWACAMNHPNVLHVFSALGLILVVAGGWTSYVCLARTPADATIDGGRGADRSRFLAVLGLSLNALFLFVILANAVPRFILSPCQQ